MDYNNLKLYRRRYIPNEKVRLKDDVIIYADERIITTKWKTLKPRSDFDHGCSCFYIHDGFKISRFYDKNNKLLFHYCDIIEYQYDREENAYIFNDLLADVIIYEDGFVKVVDIGEIGEAVAQNIITLQQMHYALKTLDSLLNIIYDGKFDRLTEPLQGL